MRLLICVLRPAHFPLLCLGLMICLANPGSVLATEWIAYGQIRDPWSGSGTGDTAFPRAAYRKGRVIVLPELTGDATPVSSHWTSLAVRTLFFLYRQSYGRAKGHTCNFYPTCSAYGELALQQYGFPLGLLLTFGRLIRAHTDRQDYYPTFVDRYGVRFVHYPKDDRPWEYGKEEAWFRATSTDEFHTP